MQQTPQNAKYMISTQTGEQIFFQTAQDHNNSSEQSLNGKREINKKTIGNAHNIQPFNFNIKNNALQPS